MGNSFAGAWLDVSNYWLVGIQCTAPVGTHVGTLLVEESEDAGVDGFSVTPLETAVAAGLTVSAKLAHPDCTSKYIRLRYVRASGEGALTVYVTLKR
jgi:hypothetical protein